MITEFSQETINNIGSYVYRLIDPRNGNTFYVGKGKGNRVFAHVKGAMKDYLEDEDIKDNKESLKLNIIRDIHDNGMEVIHVIQRWGLTQKEAFEIEAALIDVYQGLSNLQKGHDYERGVTNAEMLEKRFVLPEYEEPTDFQYLIIKVKQWRLDELFEKYPETYRYEATRYAWKVNPKSVEKCPYVFSVTDGIVREVYKIKDWYFAEDRNRQAFNGEIADKSIRDRFVDKRIPEKYIKKGMANPVLFSKN